MPEGGAPESVHHQAAERAGVVRDSLSGGVWLLVGVLGGFLTLPVIARVLGREALGAWQLVGAASLLMGFADLGLSTAVERAAVRNDQDGTRRAVGLTLSVISGVIPLAAAASYAFILDLPAGPLHADVAKAGILTIMGAAFFAWGQPYRFFLVAKGRYRSMARARALGAMVNMAVTIGLLLFTRRFVAPALGQLVGYVTDAAITLHAARRVDPLIPLAPHAPRDRSEGLAALRDGAAGFSINLATVTALRVDLLVISRVADLATVAAYCVGGRAVEIAFLVAKQSVVGITSRLGSASGRSPAVHVATLLFGGVIGAWMVALSVVGQGLLVLWAGPVAVGRVPAIAMAVLGLAAFIAALYTAASTSVVLGGQSAWAGATPVVVGAGVNLAISLSLSPCFGVWAVAWSTVAGNLVTAALTWRAAVRMLGWSLRDLSRLLARAGAPALAALAVCLPLRAVAWHHGLRSLPASALACLVGLGTIALAYRQARSPVGAPAPACGPT